MKSESWYKEYRITFVGCFGFGLIDMKTEN